MIEDEDLIEEEWVEQVQRIERDLALTDQERQDRHHQKVTEARRPIRPPRIRPRDIRPQFFRKIP